MEKINEFSPISEEARHGAPERDTSRHLLTIKQAARLFAQIGVPRAPRSVQRFCEIGSIDCIRVKGEKTERYFVNRESVERYAQELKHLEHISNISGEDDSARHDAPQRDIARNGAPRREEPQAVVPTETPIQDDEILMLRGRVDALEKEKFQLTIDRAAKETVINQMLGERREWIDRLTEQGREIGRLEMQVLQLAAPIDATTRHDAPDVTERGAPPSAPSPARAEITSEIQPGSITQPVPRPPKRSVWDKMFG